MFTGIVEEAGRVISFAQGAASWRLQIAAGATLAGVALGDSIAVNGCCLTVTLAQDGILVFDLLEETLRKTNLGALKPGSVVNLERSLAVGSRLGGHFVQGHVDTTIALLRFEKHGADLRLDFEMPPEFAGYIAYKGSVAINGTSLTIAEVREDSFTLWIIPHTASATNLGALHAGEQVNLECDMLAKYTARLLQVAGREL